MSISPVQQVVVPLPPLEALQALRGDMQVEYLRLVSEHHQAEERAALLRARVQRFSERILAVDGAIFALKELDQ